MVLTVHQSGMILKNTYFSKFFANLLLDIGNTDREQVNPKEGQAKGIMS